MRLAGETVILWGLGGSFVILDLSHLSLICAALPCAALV